MRRVTQPEFFDHLHRIERLRNAGSLTRHRPRLDDTLWIVAGRLVAVSTGPVGASRAYFID